jgi:dihydrofolate synthase / folylpolyglutamate synthase
MRFATVREWLDWQASLHPRAIELGLDRVRRVWAALGTPLLGAPVLTVAGTNGKGSSVAFAEAILAADGYRVGCYTSPHLQRYNERIRVDGCAVTDDVLCAAFARIDQARGNTRLTYFEFGTLAALLVFADTPLDAIVLEVGLGGRLDAVNLVDADVALITQIDLDHQDWLGPDRESIGFEKAGIMRAGRPVVYSGTQMPGRIRDHAAAVGARLYVAGHDYRVQRRQDAWDLEASPPLSTRRALNLPGMRGAIQVANAAGALVALDCLATDLPLTQQGVRAGLLGARVGGRFEVRPGAPTWILDVAHNPSAALGLDGLLADQFCAGERVAVFGMLADKDVEGVAGALAGRFERWHLLDLSDQPRGLPAEALRERLLRVPGIAGSQVELQPGRDETFDAVSRRYGAADTVVVFGSFLTVGAAMDWLDARHRT